MRVDTTAIAANWRTLAALAPGLETAGVVKADAYGHGAVAAARALAAAGCRTFFTATQGEALEVRTALGPGPRILALNGLAGADPAGLVQAGIEPVLNTLQEIQAWAGAGPSALRFAERMEDGRWAFVADRADGELLGFIDLEADGHIDFLYVAPEAKGRGVADRLLDAVEQVARSAEVQRLYSEASEAARRFFVRRGFVVLRRRDFEVGGVPIHNYAVEKRL